VPVLSDRAALIIAHDRGGVVIHVFLNEAGAPDLADHRKAQGEVLRGNGQSETEADEA
jgi:hypothetical protein